MSDKIKILFYGDAPTVATGFGTVSRNVLTGLNDTGKYDIKVLGVNYWGNPHSFPFPIWPVGVGSRDPYGRQRCLDKMLQDFEYDILFLLQDSFILESFMAQGLPKLRQRKKFVTVGYFPIDGVPKKKWIDCMNTFDVPVTYTEFAKKECILACPPIADKIKIIPHGANLDDFFPMSKKDTQQFRQEYFGKHASKFIICFPEGHKLWTSEGAQDISQISPGASVLTHKNRYRKVLKTFENEFSGELTRISLTGTDFISGTGEHPVMVAKRKDVLCKYSGTSRNNYVCRPKEKDVKYSRPCSTCGYYEDFRVELEDFTFTPLKKVEKGDFVLTPIDTNFGTPTEYLDCENSTTHGNAKLLPTTVPVSEELMYSFGLWLAEGCYMTNATGLTIKMGASDKSFRCLDRYKLGIKKAFGIESNTYIRRDVECLLPNGEVFTDDFVSVNFCSVNLAAMFLCWFGNLSDGKFVNSVFERMPPKTQLALFEGYRDGDGCTRRNNHSNSDRVDCVSASKILLEAIRRILLRNGVFGSIYEDKKLVDRKQMYRYVAQGSGIRSWRDQEDMTKVVRSRFILDGFLVSEVQGAEQIPFTGKVYNVEVEEDNTYVVDNIVVHNCNVNRNQQRKDIPRMMLAFKEFKKRRPDSVLYLHMAPIDQGWDLVETVKGLGLTINEDVLFPGANFSPNHGFPIDVVNKIYNASDVVASTTLGEGWGLCVHGDTHIMTSQGMQPIRDLEVGNSVVVGGKEHVVSGVSSTRRTKNYKIELENHMVVDSSADHKFVTYNRGYVSASDLKAGDSLVVDKAKFFPSKNHIIDLSSFSDTFDENFVWNKMGFSPKNNFSISNTMKHMDETKKVVETAIRFYDGRRKGKMSDRVHKVYSYIEGKYESPLVKLPRYVTFNSDFARLLGYYAAEGSNENGVSVEFAFHVKEEEYISDVSRLCFSFFGRYPQVKIRGNKAEVRFRSSILSKLFSLFCGKGATHKKVPLLCLQHREKVVEFLRGYWRGDGSYGKHNFSFSTASRQLRDEVVWMLSGFDILPRIYKKSNPTNDAWNIVIVGSDFNKFASLMNLSVKHDTHKEKNWVIDKGDFFIVPIKSVSVQKVNDLYYDIQVDNKHHFTVNGVLVHNSTVEAMACKTPIVFPDNTSLHEIIGEDRGFLVKSGETPDDYTVLPNDNEVLRPVASVMDMAEKLLQVYDNRALATERAQNAYNWVTSNLVWKKHIVPEWDKLITGAVSDWVKGQIINSDAVVSAEEL